MNATTLSIPTTEPVGLLYVPEGFEGEPVDALDVLKRAKALLEEEGRWCTGNDWGANLKQRKQNDPFCGNWTACARGAVALVSIGVEKVNPSSDAWLLGLPVEPAYDEGDVPPKARLFNQAMGVLNAAVDPYSR